MRSLGRVYDESASVRHGWRSLPASGRQANQSDLSTKKKVRMKQILVAAALIVTVALAPSVLLAQSAVLVQPPGIKRTDLMRNDLSAPGREVIQVLVEFAPGVAFPKHSHPGEELVYVVEGSLEYALEGRMPVTLNAGDVLFIPAGTPHAVRNIGSGKAAELATYLVTKGRPLLVPSE
jgi:quercetin dioxygenase-like cupin family protein